MKPGKGFLMVALSLALQAAGAPSPVDAPALRNWAWDTAKAWRCWKLDARGQRQGDPVGFLGLGYAQQTTELLARLGGSPAERRAALLLLGDRPTAQWGPQALAQDRPESRDEAALWLFRHGYRGAGQDPYAYLDPANVVTRPWTQGLGLHLDAAAAPAPGASQSAQAAAGWSFQWIPSPALLPRRQGAAGLPAALEAAPIPSVLLRLRQLRPGLEQLQALAGGAAGLPGTLASGSRAGFWLRQLGPWLRQPPPGLAPLAGREAWVLHYGLDRGFGPAAGTLVFLPGDLPARTSLVLDLLSLNPVAAGPRARTRTWEDGQGGRARVEQVRGAGGVLHILAGPGGTWICDREAPLRAVAFPAPFPTLGERPEWARVAMAAVRPSTQVSLWLLPRLGAGAAFERVALRRRALGLDQPTWPNPAIAKAAPRTGVLTAALGAGPTEVLLKTLLRQDQDPVPTLEPLPSGPLQPTPEQRRDHAREAAALALRRKNQAALAADAAALQAMLDLRGAAFLWRGWVRPPALDPAQAAALQAFQQLRRTDAGKAGRLLRRRRIDAFGGFLEPGLAPELGLALPIRAGQAGNAAQQLARLWPRLFLGRLQHTDYAPGVTVHRVLTEQAFRPAYALCGDTLVLGTDDEAVRDMLAGSMGQAPSLADRASAAYGRAELDGERAAQALSQLLLAYLRANAGGGDPWLEDADAQPSGDDAAAELAASFGPFLGALRALGRQPLALELTAAGFEARPQ